MEFKISRNGAELISLKDNFGREIIHQPDSIWKWSSPIIFPTLGKSKDDQILYNSEKFFMKQHGIARISSARPLIDRNNHKLYQIQSNLVSKINYPFEFRLLVEYLLKNDILYVTNIVTNIGSIPMYFNIGAHPGFNLFENSSLEDYILIFSEEENDIVFSRDISGLNVFSNNCLHLSNNLISNNSLFMKNLKSDSVILKNKKTGEGIKMEFSTNCLGVWTRYTPLKQFVCLEPWQTFSNPNYDGDISNKPDITKLEPGKDYNFNYSIKVIK